MLSELADELRDRIKTKSATAADLNVARQFIKDLDIQAVPTQHNSVGKLLADLPFTADDADEARPQ